MKLILDVPDEHFDAAIRLVRKEMRDYRTRYEKPGWGWTFYEAGERFFVRGIKGGLSVRPAPIPAPPQTLDGETP